jgi:translation initiation factor 2B subunit (eIF-2B alpha/beta/delta family)/8-oxo-dGTP pyrophosphatase MutT (NUDIX family)
MIMVATSIKRVVSCFILSGNSTRETLKIAVFHRCDTMPTFPSHWAACSGSIEEGETPFQTASRELHEETNLLSAIPNKQQGIYVDVHVPFRQTEDRETIIRVYPCTVQLPPGLQLELRGTEHDYFKFISVQELEELNPAVPSLARAFHHATCGKFLDRTVVSEKVLQWANDHTSGAADMARNALALVKDHDADPTIIRMFRPSMVAITNSMNQVIGGESVDNVLASLDAEATRAAEYAVNELQPLLQDKSKENPLIICTFSRSSTLVKILQNLLLNDYDKIQVICSKSTPGDEGILMAKELGGVECIDDDDLLNLVRQDKIDVVLVGSDCVTEESVVNKVGTKRLAEAAKTSSRAKVFCCTDRFKQWNDIFPPPLEDIFEEIPIDLFDKMLLPPPSLEQQCRRRLGS